jgi:hypothetical protein
VKKKYAIITIAIGESYLKLGRLTHPLFRSYAAKVGADFIVVTEHHTSQFSPHFAKYCLFDWLGKYDRVIYVDSDALIVSDCPDLFQIVPNGQLGVFFEENDPKPTKRVMETQEICGTVDGWSGTFFNTGVMVLSSSHRSIFDTDLGLHSIGKEFEQAQLNWNVHKLHIPVFDIGRKFNHIVWESDGSRYNSSIIHYVFCCPPRWMSRLMKIRIDKFIFSTAPPLRRILINLRIFFVKAVARLLAVTLPLRMIFGAYNRGL